MNTRAPTANSRLEIWQWNCRSLQRKQHSLEKYIEAAPIQPDIICLQEVGNNPRLLGYYTIKENEATRIATLVKKDVTAIEHKLATTASHALLVELIPTKRGRKSTFVLNLYSPPSSRAENFEKLFRETITKSKDNQVIIAGDFNAPHTEWGYKRNTKKGENLISAAETCNLTFITDPNQPTRADGEQSSDTCPDLTLEKNDEDVTWTNLKENIGSDHAIISISVPTAKLRRNL